jgi:inosine-uridine nucleoside N-ribohydrolase
MGLNRIVPLTVILFFVALTSSAARAQTKRKVIIDQDARGAATTDQQSILMFLQSPNVETLGITVVSGDMWRDEEVAHTLRMLELTGHQDIPVYPGSVYPLINRVEWPPPRHESGRRPARKISSALRSSRSRRR